jgi:predicted Zn-dependent peptidase
MTKQEFEEALRKVREAFDNPVIKEMIPITESDFARTRARTLSYLSTGTEDNWMKYLEKDL